MLDLSSIAVFIPRAVVQGIPLLYGATGEILTEKSGNLNLGIPGIMYVGAISGVMGAHFYEQSAGGQLAALPAILIPLLCSLIGSAHRQRDRVDLPRSHERLLLREASLCR